MTAAPTLLVWLSVSLPSPEPPIAPTWPGVLRTPAGLVVLASGPHELEVGAGGFTEAGGRRLAFELDGRDLTLPVFGGLATTAPGLPASEIAAIELTPGPGAGTGVEGRAAGRVDLRTRRGGVSPGWQLSLGAGEREFRRLGLRGAGDRGALATTGWLEAESDAGFRSSRTAGAAQPGQPREVVALERAREERLGAGFRLDRGVGTGPSWQLAAGAGRQRGAIRLTPFGRAEERRADGAWVRAELAGSRFHGSLHHTRHDARDLVLLFSGSAAPLTESRTVLTVGLERPLGRGRVSLAGELARDEATAGGPEPVLRGDPRVDRKGLRVGGQVELGRTLAAALAVRWEASDALPEARLSGRFELAWSPAPDHRLALGWGTGHGTPTLAERHGRFRLGAPLDLAIFEQAFGLRLGFDAVPTVAIGNPDLDPERVTGLELVYRGTAGPLSIATRVFRDRHRDFVGDFALGAGPARPAYTVPSSVPPEIARRFLATLDAFLPASLRAALSEDEQGRPLLVLSLVNGGRAEILGFDAQVAVRAAGGFRGALELGYLGLDSESEPPGGTIVLNAPEKRVRLILGWHGARGGAQILTRWHDDFEWAAGSFRGVVREATIVDLVARYQSSDFVEWGFAVDDLGGERHAETFGGDVWGRQARLFLTWRLGAEAAG